MSELKPCPFCGKENTAMLETAKSCEECLHFEDEKCPAYEDNDCPFKAIVCCCYKGGCGASSGWRTSVDEVIKLWNMRAN